MREIKFRGKTKRGTWVYGNLGKHNSTLGGKVYAFSYVIFQDVYEFDSDNFSFIVQDHAVLEDTIGQYTGIKDKNGKEIYEGDIVNWLFFACGPRGEYEHYIKGVIKYRQGGFILDIIKGDFEDAGFYGISELHFDEESIEILGNVHDNPELLENYGKTDI